MQQEAGRPRAARWSGAAGDSSPCSMQLPRQVQAPAVLHRYLCQPGLFPALSALPAPLRGKEYSRLATLLATGTGTIFPSAKSQGVGYCIQTLELHNWGRREWCATAHAFYVFKGAHADIDRMEARRDATRLRSTHCRRLSARRGEFRAVIISHAGSARKEAAGMG